MEVLIDLLLVWSIVGDPACHKHTLVQEVLCGDDQQARSE